MPKIYSCLFASRVKKFIVVVPKHTLRAAKKEAKRFPCRFLVSKFLAGVRVVVVVVGGFTAAIKITIVTRYLQPSSL